MEDVSNDPDAYNCVFEEPGQNSIDDADADVKVEENIMTVNKCI